MILSLKYLEPEVYYDLVEKIASAKRVPGKHLSRVIVDEVKAHIDEAGIKAQIDGRSKALFQYL